MHAEVGVRNRVVIVILSLSLFMSAFSDIPANGGFSAPYFQADYIQDLSEFSAAFINPALMYRVNQFRLDIGIWRWGKYNPVDDLGYQQLSMLFPIRLRQTFGFSVISSGSDFDKMVLDKTDKMPKKEGSSSYWERWLIAHYSLKILPWLCFGTNVKFVLQDQFGKIKGSAGIDLGLYSNLFDHYRFGDLGVSVNLQDIIPANIRWAADNETIQFPVIKLNSDSTNFDTSYIPKKIISKQLMTTRMRTGLRYAVINDRLIFNVEGVFDNLFQKIWTSLLSGVEKNDSTVDHWDTLKTKTGKQVEIPVMKYRPDKDIVPRLSGHVRFQLIPQLWLKLGWANNNIPYIGINFNSIYPLGAEWINYVSFDIHFGYSVNEQERGPTGMLKLATDFGPTREQRESKRMYDLLVLAPMDAYNQAMRLYVAKKYWEASFAFGKVLSLFPNFHLNDKASYYMGDCYTKLYLNDIAREVFDNALAEYTTSEMRSKYLFGLEYIDYREGKSKDVLRNQAFISNLYAQSEVRPDADYLAGEILFLQKNYGAAALMLSGVKRGSASYVFAQYTLSVINVQNNKTAAAIENLNAITSDSAKTEDEVLLKQAAFVKLGQLYYEEVDLRKAVEAFKSVPEGSRYGDESLLGIAWSWIKANRPQECLNALAQLMSVHSKSPYMPEAYLLKGYALMLQKQNEEALIALDECSKLCASSSYATEEELAARKGKYKQFVSEFAPTAVKIKKNALRKPTDKTVAERGEFKNQFDIYKKETNEIFDFSQVVENNKKFFMRKEQIVADAEYAIAKVSKILGSAKMKEILERERKKQEKIDSEIKKLEKELKNLDNNKDQQQKQEQGSDQGLDQDLNIYQNTEENQE